MPVGLYAQGPGGTALAVAIEAARAGADPDRHRLLSRRDADHSGPPPSCSAQALSGLGFDAGLDREIGLGGRAPRSRPRSATPPRSRRRSRRTWRCAPRSRRCPIGARRRRRAPPARGRRRATASTRCSTSCCACAPRAATPPPASPVGRILATQAIQPRAARAPLDRGRRRDAPPAARRVRPRARRRSTRSRAPSPSATPASTDRRAVARGGARGGRHASPTSEEELCLVALFGERALPLLAAPARPRRPTSATRTRSTTTRRERVRRLCGLLEESDAGELTVEEATCASRCAAASRPTSARCSSPPPLAAASAPAAAPAAPPSDSSVSRREPDGRQLLPLVVAELADRSSRRATASRSGRRSASSRP